MGETNFPSVAHVGYDISPLSRGCGSNFKFNSLEWRNIVTHGKLKENLYFYGCSTQYFSKIKVISIIVRENRYTHMTEVMDKLYHIKL
jgi:hypothetical protein